MLQDGYSSVLEKAHKPVQTAQTISERAEIC